MAVKYSQANAKTEALAAVPSLAKFLTDKRKIFSFDLLSGFSCPFAKECLSKAIVNPDTGKRTIKDGPDTQFRCFSASQEVQYTNVYNRRKENFETLRGLESEEILDHLTAAMPTKMGICRIHVAGDFYNQKYFDAWLAMAARFPGTLFYAYTKSLNFWLVRRKEVNGLPNFVLTASYGGRLDSQIGKRRLRYAKVVFSTAEAGKLDIDHDDSHAADPDKKRQSFALLLHGTQPKGSEAGVALRELKGEGSYSRKKGG